MIGWWISLGLSLLLLLIVLVRSRLSWRWFSFAALHIVIAAVALYLVDVTGLFIDIYIPINLVTMSVIAVLGVPGLALLVAVKTVVL